jgi:hypothetical protein
MHRAAAISLAILLASTALTAQTTPRTGFGVASMEGIGPAQAQATVVQAPPPSCPVNLTARQSPGANRMEVNGVQAKGIVQNLHLTVTGPNSKRVVAAKVTVYGFAGKVRAVETSSAQAPSDAKTFDVRFPSGPSEIATDLAVPGFSGVRVIDLNAVTYADGSTWKLAAGSTCSSRIDPIMQVSGR